ncbi:LOW QUALITY PROTEIN: interferon-inducible double-stranded RNA-dependent protein kinase activator A homolog [Drosophila eugracilis]|uniref:LOW QUALITY PROTEIN: interferon-inducible double-stranded RNA-dependent protein kinase activator A homolog n=1 Tax=Drosophila eugracilis TaxID=29029 RepID=UPI001BD99476|nr:LOW QUALITY PROTEIN: interferon-inducible double-stranded RNA-dependent protein kinase activator A homolog [Drosophila eugracilis]
MDQENFHGHSLPQQLQNLHIQQQSHQNPVQTGFAPRRQYENIGGMGNGNVSGGSPVKGVPMGQRTLKMKKEKVAAHVPQLPLSSQLQLSELGDPSLAGGSGGQGVAGLIGGIMPSDETLKFVSETDANGLAMKTPVSILQELLSRRGITPGYELVQIEGAIHEPTFRFRVSFKDKDTPFTAMGAGRSKKEAKHAAARALIDKLIGAQLPESPSSSAGPSVTGLTVAGSGGDGNANATGGGDSGDKIVGNPIGWLQEMCMQRRWPPPSYETETEVGLPHERLFTIACSILNYREMGKGKSKKIAKRLAAHRMWMRLQETPIDSAKISDSICGELEGEPRNSDNYFGELKDISVPTLTTQHSNKVSQFHKVLKNATGKKLLKLQKTCLKSTKIDFIKLLGEIATENQFEVTYVDIEEKTYSDQFQCLVQLSTLPVGVCHGSGPTAADAQRHAAQNALEYLKIMTKK